MSTVDVRRGGKMQKLPCHKNSNSVKTCGMEMDLKRMNISTFGKDFCLG